MLQQAFYMPCQEQNGLLAADESSMKTCKPTRSPNASIGKLTGPKTVTTKSTPITNGYFKDESPSSAFVYASSRLEKGSSIHLHSADAEDHVRRPMNAFMAWAKDRRKRLAAENPGMHNADLSKILGKEWRSMSQKDRQPYIQVAEDIRQKHLREHPNYKYKPKRRKRSKAEEAAAHSLIAPTLLDIPTIRPEKKSSSQKRGSHCKQPIKIETELSPSTVVGYGSHLQSLNNVTAISPGTSKVGAPNAQLDIAPFMQSPSYGAYYAQNHQYNAPVCGPITDDSLQQFHSPGSRISVYHEKHVTIQEFRLPVTRSEGHQSWYQSAPTDFMASIPPQSSTVGEESVRRLTSLDSPQQSPATFTCRSTTFDPATEGFMPQANVSRLEGRDLLMNHESNRHMLDQYLPHSGANFNYEIGSSSVAALMSRSNENFVSGSPSSDDTATFLSS